MGRDCTDKKEMLEKLCADTWKNVYRFICYKVQNREEAEDITQEAYAKALAYFGRRDIQVSDYVNYLKTIAINVLRDRWRARAGKDILSETGDLEEAVSEDFTEVLNDRTVLEAAMAALTAEQRTVISLRIIKGYSVRETARLMRKKESTVRVIQYRALKALSEQLSDQ